MMMNDDKKITVLAALHSIKMIWPTDKRNTCASPINKMLSSLLSSHITVSNNLREFLRQTGACKEHNRNT